MSEASQGHNRNTPFRQAVWNQCQHMSIADSRSLLSGSPCRSHSVEIQDSGGITFFLPAHAVIVSPSKLLSIKCIVSQVIQACKERLNAVSRSFDCRCCLQRSTGTEEKDRLHWQVRLDSSHVSMLCHRSGSTSTGSPLSIPVSGFEAIHLVPLLSLRPPLAPYLASRTSSFRLFRCKYSAHFPDLTEAELPRIL